MKCTFTDTIFRTMKLILGSKRPPCPDPENYVWVTTKEGSFWRRKRGTKKGATLNAQYKKSNEHMKISGPAASNLVRILRPYLQGIAPGRLTARLSGKLRKALNETGAMNYRHLAEFDVQPDHPIGKLLLCPWLLSLKGNKLALKIPIDTATLQQHNKLVTDYYFELILLQGNAANPASLDTYSVCSKLYPIGSSESSPCQLTIKVPANNWIAFLKVSCMEGKELAAAPRNYGMRVVGVG